MKAKSRKLLTAFFLVFLAIITLQNLGSIEVHFLNYSFSAPKALIIIVFFALGSFFGQLLSWWKRNSESFKL